MEKKHTLESLLKLAETEEGLLEIRVEVAKLHGYRWQKFKGAPGSFLEHPDRPFVGYTGPRVAHAKSIPVTAEFLRRWDIPDYTGSLDAAAEAEKTIKGIGCPFDHEEAHLWHDHLINACIIQSPQVFCGSAPALLRSIAVILTKQEVAE